MLCFHDCWVGAVTKSGKTIKCKQWKISRAHPWHIYNEEWYLAEQLLYSCIPCRVQVEKGTSPLHHEHQLLPVNVKFLLPEEEQWDGARRMQRWTTLSMLPCTLPSPGVGTIRRWRALPLPSGLHGINIRKRTHISFDNWNKGFALWNLVVTVWLTN